MCVVWSYRLVFIVYLWPISVMPHSQWESHTRSRRGDWSGFKFLDETVNGQKLPRMLCFCCRSVGSVGSELLKWSGFRLSINLYGRKNHNNSNNNKMSRTPCSCCFCCCSVAASLFAQETRANLSMILNWKFIFASQSSIWKQKAFISFAHLVFCQRNFLGSPASLGK